MTEALQARDLSVRLGQRELVSGVSFSAQYGALLAVAGPNGAGKSTLLKSLMGLVSCAGTVQVAGLSVGTLTRQQRAQTMGYVPQRSTMAVGVSVYDVVAQARYAHRSGLAGLAGFSRRADPVVEMALDRMGLLAMARRTFDTLSGGEQRRVLMARALATEARVLLLDEPTAGLDVGQVLQLFRLLGELRSEGYALLAVLHDLSEVRRHADHTLLLAGGRTVAYGPTCDVLTSQRVRDVYGVHAHENAALGFSLDGAL